MAAAGAKREALQPALGYAFREPRLLERALTHRSAGRDNNERLEFLGDSIINHVVAEALFHRYPEADEGQLSRQRARLVRGEYLAELARDLGLAEALILGVGERKSGGRKRASILADALEAIAGAILLDGGYASVREVLLGWFAPGLADLDLSAGKDAKTTLQEWLQGRGHPLPHYDLVDVIGEDHDQCFQVRCRLECPALEELGEGSSRRKAEQAAADLVLERLNAQ